MDSQGQVVTSVVAHSFPELELKQYLRIFGRWLWFIILCVVGAAGSAYVTSSFSIPIYQASATIMLDNTTADPYARRDIWEAEVTARTYADWMENRQSLAEIAAKLGLSTELLDEVITDITVELVRDTRLMRLNVEGVSPEVITAVATLLPEVFIRKVNESQTSGFRESRLRLEGQLATLREQIELAQIEIDEIGNAPSAADEIRLTQLRSELAMQQNSYATVLQSYETLRLAETQSVDKFVVTSAPELPKAPIRPRVLVNTMLAGIVGGMLALGFIFLIEYLDDRFRTPQDLVNLVNLPILGTIAQMADQNNGRWNRQKRLNAAKRVLIAAQEPRHPITEAYRGLRTNLRFSSVDASLKTILVTSTSPGEGKTVTAANLAAVIAQSGRSVIVVDADLRKPQLHTMFDVPKIPGLTDLLVQPDVAVDLFMRPTAIPHLQIIPSGEEPPNPAELLGSQRMGKLIDQLCELAEVVIFDAPPVLPVTDAQILAERLQGVLFVVDAQQTTRTLFVRAIERLLQTEARFLGVVYNRMTRSARSSYGYYDEYSVYYSNQLDKPQKTPSAASLSAPLKGKTTQANDVPVNSYYKLS